MNLFIIIAVIVASCILSFIAGYCWGCRLQKRLNYFDEIEKLNEKGELELL